MTTRQLILKEKIGRIFLIGINRVSKKNCINRSAATQLRNAFNDFEQDSSVDVAVLHGKGGSFCSGYDLDEIANLPKISQDNFPFDSAPMGPTRSHFSKPVIAAISGFAVAGGLELALMADLRVVEESAIMGVYCRRVGVPLIDGGTIRLPQLIGLSRALDLILTGRRVESAEALQFGLANRVVKDGTALGISVKLAQDISLNPQSCLKTDRRSTYYSTFEATSLDDAFKFEHYNGLQAVQKESIEGATKFIETAKNKRKPSKL